MVAITRAFGVSRSASRASPGSIATSCESTRCRKSSASGPATRTKSRSRRATRNAWVCLPTSVAAMFRSKAEKKVLELGYDPARLPPGQYLTEKWPVLHAGGLPHIDLDSWDFKVWGEVEKPLAPS